MDDMSILTNGEIQNIFDRTPTYFSNRHDRLAFAREIEAVIIRKLRDATIPLITDELMNKKPHHLAK